MDATNPKHVDILKRQAIQWERERRDFLLRSMGVRSGRAYFCSLLEQAHIFTTTFADNPYRGAFNEGNRNLGLMILSDIMKYCPEHYVAMMRERNERDTITDNRLERSDKDSNGRDSGQVTVNGNFVDYSDNPNDGQVHGEYEPRVEDEE
jgi:hypothetical protein